MQILTVALCIRVATISIQLIFLNEGEALPDILASPSPTNRVNNMQYYMQLHTTICNLTALNIKSRQILV